LALAFYEGVLAGFAVFVIVTLITYKITESKWSWLPGLISGVIVAIAVKDWRFEATLPF